MSLERDTLRIKAPKFQLLLLLLKLQWNCSPQIKSLTTILIKSQYLWKLLHFGIWETEAFLYTQKRQWLFLWHTHQYFNSTTEAKYLNYNFNVLQWTVCKSLKNILIFFFFHHNAGKNILTNVDRSTRLK